MIEVPIQIAVAQWVLLLGLAALLFVAFRQLAYLAQLGRDASGRGGLTIGEEAPAVEYQPFTQSGADGIAETFVPGGSPAMLLFADPGCGSCEQALNVVEEATRRERANGLRVLALARAEPGQLAALDGFRETTLPLGRIHDRVASRDYRVSATPFFYAIDEDGLVRSRGTVGTKADIKRALRAMTRKPESEESERVAVRSQ
jgi:hypothetical protein